MSQENEQETLTIEEQQALRREKVKSLGKIVIEAITITDPLKEGQGLNVHTTYLINSKMSTGNSLEKRRRFKEFELMYNILKQIILSDQKEKSNVADLDIKSFLPPFPTKTVFTRFDKKVVEKRRLQFELILNQAIKYDSVTLNGMFQDFIGLDLNNAQHFIVNQSAGVSGLGAVVAQVYSNLSSTNQQLELVTPTVDGSLTLGTYKSEVDTKIWNKFRKENSSKIIFSKDIIKRSIDSDETLSNEFDLGDEIHGRAFWPYALRNIPIAKKGSKPVYGLKHHFAYPDIKTHKLQIMQFFYVDDERVHGNTDLDIELGSWVVQDDFGAQVEEQHQAEYDEKYLGQYTDYWAFNQSIRLNIIRKDNHNFPEDEWVVSAGAVGNKFLSLEEGKHKIRYELRYRFVELPDNELKQHKKFPNFTTLVSEPISSGEFIIKIPSDKEEYRSVIVPNPLPKRQQDIKMTDEEATVCENVILDFLRDSVEWGARKTKTEIPISAAIQHGWYVASQNKVSKEILQYGFDIHVSFYHSPANGWEKEEVIVYKLCAYTTEPKKQMPPIGGIGVGTSFSIDINAIPQRVWKECEIKRYNKLTDGICAKDEGYEVVEDELPHKQFIFIPGRDNSAEDENKEEKKEVDTNSTEQRQQPEEDSIIKNESNMKENIQTEEENEVLPHKEQEKRIEEDDDEDHEIEEENSQNEKQKDEEILDRLPEDDKQDDEEVSKKEEKSEEIPEAKELNTEQIEDSSLSNKQEEEPIEELIEEEQTEEEQKDEETKTTEEVEIKEGEELEEVEEKQNHEDDNLKEETQLQDDDKEEDDSKNLTEIQPEENAHEDERNDLEDQIKNLLSQTENVFEKKTNDNKEEQHNFEGSEKEDEDEDEFEDAIEEHKEAETITNENEEHKQKDTETIQDSTHTNEN